MGKTRQTTHKISISFALIIIIGAAIASVIWRQPLMHSVHLATTHQPERLSELYFAQPNDLPKELIANKPTTVNIVIANHENMDYTYEFQIIVVENGVASEQETNNVEVGNGQSLVKPVRFQATEPGSKIEVFVKLLNKNQVVHFSAETDA